MSAQPHWGERPFPMIPSPVWKDAKPDVFETTATEMVLVHNVILRGLNSIYNQAPYIREADVHGFLNYSKLWCVCLRLHHHGEETFFFPEIEKMAGQTGIMDANRDQHHAFETGVEALEKFVDDCLANQAQYDGGKLVKLIDPFGQVLMQHLRDEIPTLLGLERFGHDRMSGLKKLLETDGKQNMSKAGLTTGVPQILALHDVTWENGLHSDFPPAPWVLLAVIRNVTARVHADWWKYAPCTVHGYPKDQYAKPPTQ